jgi:hypothetical protein
MIDFVHVGIQKSASSYLQHGLFAQHPQLQVARPRLETAPFIQQLRLLPDDAFDAADWSERFRASFDEVLGKPAAGRTLRGISDENLVGHIFDARGSRSIMRRLHAAYPSAKIILILRHPLAYITSGYTQGVQYGTVTGGPRKFLQRRQTGLRRKLDYRRLLDRYTSTFGADKVLCLPFELLVESEALFLEKICHFLGIPAPPAIEVSRARRNPSFSLPYNMILRTINGIDRSFFMKARQGRWLFRRVKRFMSSPWGSKIDSYLPKRKCMTLDDIREFPQLRAQLEDEHYQLWSGELAKFNYTFGA